MKHKIVWLLVLVLIAPVACSSSGSAANGEHTLGEATGNGQPAAANGADETNGENTPSEDSRNSQEAPAIAAEETSRAESHSVATFLMFEGDAEEAMNLYVSLLPDSRVDSVERYGEGEAGPPGSILVAHFTLIGRPFMCIDSPIAHGFGFTPAISLFVTCDEAAEVDRLFEALSEGGEIAMPLGEYPFSKRFAWVVDRFGVSWQIALIGE